MNSLSYKEYESIKSLYESVYSPERFETILDEFTDEDLLYNFSDEYIEESVEEFFIECMTEGMTIDEIENILTESIESSIRLLNERVDPETQRRRTMAKDRLETSRAMKSAASKPKLNVTKSKVGGSSDSDSPKPNRKEALKKVGSAVKKVASGLKAGAKVAGKAAQGGIGLAARAVGTAQRAGERAKSAAQSGYERGRHGSGGSSSGGSSSSDSGSSSGSSGRSSGGGSSSYAPSRKKRKDGLLKRGLKKLVRGAGKVVSTAAGAVKAGADYVTDRARKEELEATGLFSEKEIEAIMEAEVQELYKGKHGQSEKEYMDSRSDAGKQISGDSKMSGAAYSHRSYRGVGKPAKPGERQKAQGRMTPADRNELAIRKAALKKEEVESVDEALTGERAKKALKKPGGTAYTRKVSADPAKRATRGGRGGESDFGAGDRGAGNKAARRAGTYED